jgi:polysaccharide biosynthesis/export protein
MSTKLETGGPRRIRNNLCREVRHSMPGYALIFGLLSAFSVSAWAADRMLILDEPYRLGQGDIISITVWKHPNLSEKVPIGPDGRIGYPLIGELEVAGLTISEIQHQVSKKMRSHILDAQVSVVLSALHSYRIYVMGQVISPGVFELDGPITVVQALAMAGGFTPFASKSHISVVNPWHEDGNPRSFDYDAFTSSKVPSASIFLQPGDTVLVR